MTKIALLVGVGEYASGLSPLPNTTKDIEAMQRVLADPLMGEFDQVKTLINPDRQQMESEIETLFSSRDKSDLTLLYFTGHGIKNDRGDLYFATHQTRKTEKGELVKSTAVAADFVHKIMNDSRSKRQVVILDCCFSGAFAEGMTAKDDGVVDIQAQLGGEGRAVLTSSTSTQYSFEQDGTDLSIYTRYVVEGIETGAADLDSDGIVAVDELHDYAKNRVQETAPAMKPEIYAVKEGYRIFLSHATPSDPQLHYRREVQRFTSRGEISDIARTALEALQSSLNLTPETADRIEEEVLEPSREHQKNLRNYEQTFFEAVWREYPLSKTTINDLKYLQRILGLRDEDVCPIEARVLSRKASMQAGTVSAPQPSAPQPVSMRPSSVPTPGQGEAVSRSPLSGAPLMATTEAIPELHPVAGERGEDGRKSRGWAIALWTVIIGLGLTGGGYGYWRWQRYQDVVAMNQAAQQALTQAEQTFTAGDLDGAIAHLNTIPPESHLYGHAQETAQTWRSQWGNDEILFNDLIWALQSADDLQGAQVRADQMVTPHWQEEAAQAIAAARERVDANMQQRLQDEQAAKELAQREAAAARRDAEEAEKEAEWERQSQAFLRNPPAPGSIYRTVGEDNLNVRYPSNDGVIGRPFHQLRLGTRVRVTGAQDLARLDDANVVWVEISEPVSGWISRRMIAGPVSGGSGDEAQNEPESADTI